MNKIILSLILISFTAYSQPNKRSKSINFEDDLIEGINRKPLDSVNQISDNAKNKKQHLYKKRAGFSDRDSTLIMELKLQQ